ncbi:MAG: hypothetical protein WBR18_14840, partial [Anaerolineales bacterium]
GYEDRSTTPVLILAALVALAVSMSWLDRRQHQIGGHRWTVAAIGALIGGSVPLLAALLILVKVSLHGHAPADFSQTDIRQVLGRWSVWTAAGLLAGIGWMLAHGGRRSAYIDKVGPVEYNENAEEEERVRTDD